MLEDMEQKLRAELIRASHADGLGIFRSDFIGGIEQHDPAGCDTGDEPLTCVYTGINDIGILFVRNNNDIGIDYDLGHSAARRA